MHQGTVRVHVHAGLTGIVLAGGRSSRFGRDKLAERYRGTPLLHHTLRRVGELCDELVLVLAPGSGTPDLPPELDVVIARDAAPYEGPLAGAHAGLLAASGELALLVGGDMPEPSIPVLAAMVRLAREAEAEAVVLREGDRLRPLPTVVRVDPARRTAAGLLRAGERRLRSLLGALRTEALEEGIWVALDPERRTLLDVDEPADLESLGPER
ncbi:MAG: putative molybdenum cofactor guanylyltransferase [Actinomycetota bacterium]|nr:MAG: putative molybdenum cofactor guanylyltransferase [Actinomycetota bacterium]